MCAIRSWTKLLSSVLLYFYILGFIGNILVDIRFVIKLYSIGSLTIIMLIDLAGLAAGFALNGLIPVPEICYLVLKYIEIFIFRLLLSYIQ